MGIFPSRAYGLRWQIEPEIMREKMSLSRESRQPPALSKDYIRNNLELNGVPFPGDAAMLRAAKKATLRLERHRQSGCVHF